MPRHIGTCFRFYTQMRVEKKTKAFAYKIYSHFTQQCRILISSIALGAKYSFYVKSIETHARAFFKVIIFSIASVCVSSNLCQRKKY